MRELSSFQKQVLAEIAWDARAPIEEIARRLRVRPHAVRHAFRVIEERLELKPVCWTDPFVQGQTPFFVFLSVDCPNATKLRQFIKHINGLPEVHFFASIVGQYQFALTIFAHGLEDLLPTLQRLDEAHGEIIVDKTISNIADLVFFAPALAQAREGKRKRLSCKPTSVRAKLDDLDHKIIREIREKPLASLSELSRLCGCPASTTAYRFEQLIKSGTILGFGFTYSTLKEGRFYFIISVATRGVSSAVFNDFVAFAESHPHVSWIARSIGHWDIQMEAVVADLKELELLVQQIRGKGDGRVQEIVVHTTHEWFKG